MARFATFTRPPPRPETETRAEVIVRDNVPSLDDGREKANVLAESMNAQTMERPMVARAAAPASAPPGRLFSMDAYRGFVMLLMMGEVLRFHRVAEVRPQSWFWQLLAHHQSHVEWIGCSLHDL